jgi:small subunit ribosomal protein S5
MVPAKAAWNSKGLIGEQFMANYVEQQVMEGQVEQLDERVIEIARVAKVVKGGRRFQFRVTLIVGDNHGKVGMGVGKANAVPDAMRKATERARKDMHAVFLSGTTIPHQSVGKVGGSIILLKPASPGTGVIAGGGVRAVLEAVGIHDILTKSLGSSNVLNSVQATLKALEALKSPKEEATRRGKPVEELLPYWERSKKNG